MLQKIIKHHESPCAGVKNLFQFPGVPCASLFCCATFAKHFRFNERELFLGEIFSASFSDFFFFMYKSW